MTTLTVQELEKLESFATDIRIATLEQLGNLGFGHVGGAMSIVELLAVLYGKVMRVDPHNPNWEDRDWLVLSKGHAGPSLYATLALRGYFPLEMLQTLNQPGTKLPSHADRNLTPGIDMTTGSLGQGISTGLGVAWANRYDGRSNYVYIVLGDGECQEGQIWEGALFGGNARLGNCIVFVDYNRQQLDGYVDEINPLGNFTEKWKSFGWHTQEVDGHNLEAIFTAINKAKAVQDQSSVIILQTQKGKGCNFAEGVEFNHHMRFQPGQIEGAVQALRGECK